MQVTVRPGGVSPLRGWGLPGGAAAATVALPGALSALADDPREDLDDPGVELAPGVGAFSSCSATSGESALR